MKTAAATTAFQFFSLLFLFVRDGRSKEQYVVMYV